MTDSSNEPGVGLQLKDFGAADPISLTDLIYVSQDGVESKAVAQQFLDFMAANGGSGVVLTNGAPSNAAGRNGQLALDPINGVSYGPKANGIWPNGVNLGLVFAQPGTGAVSTTGLQKLQERVSIKDFGAVMDGSTDDTGAIQAAVNYCVSNGAILWIPRGQTLVSYRGQQLLNYGSAQFGNYAVIANGTLNVICEGTILIPCGDTGFASFLLVNGAMGGVINGVVGQGVGIATAQHQKSGAVVVLNNCQDTHVTNIRSTDCLGTVLRFGCSNCVTSFSIGSRTNFALENSSFFGSYQCDNCFMFHCRTYGGCNDGDLGEFGSGGRNRILNCKCVSYTEGDTTKTLSSDFNQGIYIDSGQRHCSVEGCYVYGHYVGIDVKTYAVATRVIGNVCETNKVGIAVRWGEGGGYNEICEIASNLIIPGIGNGSTGVLYTLPMTFSTGVVNFGFTQIGIWLQDTFGANIHDNVIGTTFQDATGTPFTFIGILDQKVNTTSVSSTEHGTHIHHNHFAYYSNQNGANARCIGPFIVCNGLPAAPRGLVQISGNTCATYPGGDSVQNFPRIVATYVTKFVMTSDNNFAENPNNFTNEPQPRVVLSNIGRAQVSGTWGGYYRLLVASAVKALRFWDNQYDAAVVWTGHTSLPAIAVDTVDLVSVIRNQADNDSGSFPEGTPHIAITNASGSTARVMITENQFRIANNSPATFYSINGTLNATGANIVVGNNMIAS